MNLKKAFFFMLTIAALIFIIIQATWYFCPPLWEARIIKVNTDWSGIIVKLFLVTLFLAVINYLLYQQKGSDNEAYQIDKWFLASSSTVLVYYVISYLILPLILIYVVGIA
ncbi:MAG: hypothetical protein ABRQ26_16390 [Syntrophomonadaceae bacterium]|jgi:hypothetical protein